MIIKGIPRSVIKKKLLYALADCNDCNDFDVSLVRFLEPLWGHG